MTSRVTIDQGAVDRIVDVKAARGMEAAGKFMADQQKAAVGSRRVADIIGHESGKDMRGWYARAGVKSGAQRSAGFFWYFIEYRTGRGSPGQPFLRTSLWNNTRRISRLMIGGR